MSILLTGGAGYIGSHVAIDLVAAGEQVIVIDDLSIGFAWALPHEVTLIIGDYGDAALLGELLSHYQIDTIIHFAAKIIAPESVTDPLDYYENNAAKTVTLLQQAVKASVPHFILASSAAVYGVQNLSSISEEEPTNPINPYGRTKLINEWMLEDTARAHQMTFVALRFFNACGADPYGRAGQNKWDAPHLINIAVQAALGRRSCVDVYGTDYPTPDGSCIRDYIHVTDLAHANMAALKYLRLGGASTTCNIGYGHGYSVLEVINTVKRVSGSEFKVRLLERRAGDPSIVVASSGLAQKRLGWMPRHADLEDIIRHTLAWERRSNNRLPKINVTRAEAL